MKDMALFTLRPEFFDHGQTDFISNNDNIGLSKRQGHQREDRRTETIVVHMTRERNHGEKQRAHIGVVEKRKEVDQWMARNAQRREAWSLKRSN